MTIKAPLVKELRELTGAGIMECKQALEKADGDLDTALSIMRKSGQAKVIKKIGRVAAEGVVVIKESLDHKTAIMVEVNCETDFVARDHLFLEFAEIIATQSLNKKAQDLTTLMSLILENGQTTLAMREELIAKFGENINVRRMKTMILNSEGMISSYIHGGRIGVLVKLSTQNADLGKDLSMHIAACNPLAILPENLPKSLLEKEKEIYLAELQNSGKSQGIVKKIVAGKIQKFINEAVLVKQAFVKNPDINIADLLNEAQARIIDFTRFEVGEGIEKKTTDFVAEVKAQVESKK